MEAHSVLSLPAEPGWQFEPKWDGFRCLAFRDGQDVQLLAKSGKTLGRFFPEIVSFLRGLHVPRFVLDGELVLPSGADPSFDALQARLHPAESRIRKLSVETPAALVLFDMLATPDGESLVQTPLESRRAALEHFVRSLGSQGAFRLSPYTRDLSTAEDWLARSGGALDGVVAKRIDGLYGVGRRDMLKVKRLRTADCVVGGFRTEKDQTLVASLLLGLFNREGKLDHVGFTSGIADRDKPALTRRLEALIEPPGFTGKSPGGPSRWSTERSDEWLPLRTELVIEVRYDHVTGDRFRHGTKLLGWRPDKAPQQCTFEQMEREPPPDLLLKGMGTR